MSKLSKSIEWRQESNPRRVRDIEPVNFAEITSSAKFVMHTPIDRTEVKLGVLLQVEGFCGTSGDEIEYQKGMARRLIIEEVFGEFRRPIMRVEEALYRRDYDKAVSELCALYETMFDA